jgi:gliding motility-associated-like protein
MTKLLTILLLLPLSLFSQEICDNGIDDDGDGLVDLNDTTDCFCGGIVMDSSGIIPSLIPNSSFEEYNACPYEYSQLSFVENWIQPSATTSDYYNTCANYQNTFSYSGNSFYQLPYPNGNGIVGILAVKNILDSGSPWQEYIGTCLNEPLQAGVEYNLQLYIASTVVRVSSWCDSTIYFGNIDFTIFGNNDCTFPTQSYGCPPDSLGWQVLGFTNYTPSEEWEIITIAFTPTTDIHALMIGSPCDLPDSYDVSSSTCTPYFFMDGLILSEMPEHVISIQTDFNACDHSGSFTAIADTVGGTWQWYHNGIAIAGATDAVFDFDQLGQGAGTYTAICSMPSGCSGSSYIVKPKTLYTSTENATSCYIYTWPRNNQVYTQSGTYVASFPAGSCDTVIELNLRINDSDTASIDTVICENNSVHFFGDDYNQTGTYYHFTQTVNGCDSVIILNLTTVSSWAAPWATLQIPQCPDEDFILVCPCEDQTNVTWIGPDGTSWSGPAIQLPTDAAQPGEYLIYYEKDNCLSDQTSVQLEEVSFAFLDAEIPNVITPNADLINDVLDRNLLYQGCEYELVIVNRWGTIVFEQDQNGQPFAGIAQDGKKLPDGVYFYKVTLQDTTKSGFIQIIW